MTIELLPYEYYEIDVSKIEAFTIAALSDGHEVYFSIGGMEMLATGRDAEELLVGLMAYHNRCIAELERFDG